MELSREPIRNGDIYCSPACGAGCTHAAFEEATKRAKALAILCTAKIGGIWKPVVTENLGWHWCVVQEHTNITIRYGGYMAKGSHYSIGLGATPVQVSLHPAIFDTPEQAYAAQRAVIQREADRWNVILKAMDEATA